MKKDETKSCLLQHSYFCYFTLVQNYQEHFNSTTTLALVKKKTHSDTIQQRIKFCTYRIQKTEGKNIGTFDYTN